MKCKNEEINNNKINWMKTTLDLFASATHLDEMLKVYSLIFISEKATVITWQKFRTVRFNWNIVEIKKKIPIKNSSVLSCKY